VNVADIIYLNNNGERLVRENAALGAGHDEARKVFDGCIADGERPIRAALLSSAQRVFEARADRSSVNPAWRPTARGIAGCFANYR
jgi:hypothetical protein